MSLLCRGILVELLWHVRNTDVCALMATSRAASALLHNVCAGGYWRMLLRARFPRVPSAHDDDDSTCLRLYAWADPSVQVETMSAGAEHSLAILQQYEDDDDDHHRYGSGVFAWGCNWSNVVSGGAQAVALGRRCVQVSAGAAHSLALLDDGRVVAWGCNNEGQVSGAAQAVPAGRRCVQVSAGGRHSLALLDDGSVVGWGADSHGQVRGAFSSVRTTGRRCVQVSAGAAHSLALLDDGCVVGWGLDSCGQVSGAVHAVPAGRRCVQVSAGCTHSLALLDDGRIVGWGFDSHGQVSRASAVVPAGRRCVQVSAGQTISVALLDNGRPVRWGLDIDRCGAYRAYPHPTTVVALSIPHGRRCVQVSADSMHSLARLDDGRVVGWGVDVASRVSGAVAPLAVSAKRSYV